jgi:hypothetical protein
MGALCPMISTWPLPPRAPRLFAALEERVLFLEPVFCVLEASHEARVGDRERHVVREHRQDLEVAGGEDARVGAVVDLEDAEDVVALPERDAHGGADLRAHERLALAHLARRVGREHGGALGHDLAVDAARDRDRGRRRARLASHPGHHGHVGGAAFARVVLVVLQDDRDVARLLDEIETSLGDRREDLGQIGGRADGLLRLVEELEAALVLLDDGRRGGQILDAAQREDARVGGSVDHDLHGDALVARAELDHVALLDGHLAPAHVGERRARLAPHDPRAVGGAEVAQDDAVADQGDPRMLARDVLVGDDEVVPLGSTDADRIGRRRQGLAREGPANDHELEHARIP